MRCPLHSPESIRTWGRDDGIPPRSAPILPLWHTPGEDSPGRQCARCQRATRDKLIAPPEVPAEFWQTEQFREAFAAQHIGRVARAYRTHPYHYAAYGPSGISQTLLGQWLSLRQTQVGRCETGPPIRDLDTLVYWARILRIPPGMLWFDTLGETRQAATPALISSDVADDPEREPVLALPWSPRGTVEAAVVLRGGGGPVKRRGFLVLTGATLTAPAHQGLVREPGPLASGLSGGRVSAGLVDQLPAMITELRAVDDVAGGGNMHSLARHSFGWVAGLLDRASYNERTGRKLHVALAELGQLASWAAYDAGQQGLAQRYYIAALRAAHSADDRPLGAHILGCMAYQAARQGQPAEAVTLIETAMAGARGRETPSLLAELHSRKAYALAILQDVSACTAAISSARTHVEQLKPGDDPPWLYWVSPAEITAGAGDCLLQLGQPDRAAGLLDEGIALFDESLARDRQLYSTHLTEALARPGKQRDLDAAASLGMAAIELAEDLDSTRSVGRIRDLYHLLQPHAQVPAVRDFLERTRGFAQV